MQLSGRRGHRDHLGSENTRTSSFGKSPDPESRNQSEKGSDRNAKTEASIRAEPSPGGDPSDYEGRKKLDAPRQVESSAHSGVPDARGK